MGRVGVNDEIGGDTKGKCSLLVGLKSSSQSLDRLALMFGEFWRISLRFRETLSLASSADKRSSR